MKVEATNDGSSTIIIEELGLTYHSRHGAIQESGHVFIDAGLNYYLREFPGKDLHIFEMGFGTGLNCLLTCAASHSLQINIDYTALELHPLPENIWGLLNYCTAQELCAYNDIFTLMHTSAWNMEVMISGNFVLTKMVGDIRSFDAQKMFDIIYFDAFAQESYPDQWSADVFCNMYKSLSPGGLLVTYSSKVIVRRALEQAGFIVQKIPGPYGKREIVRALKK